ncbi:hypothetical protein [Spiroplasma sp. AdecLV25b]|uniref:hypothetical protein n=1 Tax=Spiroplasma sp. AdecLV25b TaxID=3027162 RepID=UPI0027E06139|nr:hypothetical protein [Spiroplasma sp. AdecLV25b]
MGLWKLLGGEINWARVNKIALKEQYQIMDSIIASILFAETDAKMEDIIEYKVNRLIKIYKNQSKESMLEGFEWILKSMGVEAPTKNRYPEFERILSDPLLPSQRKLKQNPHWQENWYRAQQWLLNQEKTKLSEVEKLQLKQEILESKHKKNIDELVDWNKHLQEENEKLQNEVEYLKSIAFKESKSKKKIWGEKLTIKELQHFSRKNK